MRKAWKFLAPDIVSDMQPVPYKYVFNMRNALRQYEYGWIGWVITDNHLLNVLTVF